jgi:hypothetical protein
MGNMQMSLDKDFDSVPIKDASKAKDIISAIKKTEDKYQDELEEMYKNIQENLLKRMRRAVPVTGKKFDWDGPVGIIR